MQIEKSDYVCAGFESFAEMINNFISNKNDTFRDHFTREDIAEFFSKTCNKFLHSYGLNFPDCRNFTKYSNTEAVKLTKCKETEFFTKSEFILDSGGFQISTNRIKKEHVDIFIEMYHEFLVSHDYLYDKAFILDVPPGPGCEVFSSFTDIYRLNLLTYTKAATLPQHVKDKIIYIHHFRTPKLWEIYTKILDDNNLFPEFQHFGTGGIVANMRSDIVIPCIIYILPLIPLLNRCKKYNKTKLDFHILGGANFRDVIFYEFFKVHVLHTHGIELNISYDSSGVFKSLIVARHFLVLDRENKCINRLNLRSFNMNNHFKGKETVLSVIDRELRSLSERHGFKNIDISTVYNSETNTFFDDVKSYLMLHMLDSYAQVQTYGKEMATQIYEHYKSGDRDTFSREVFDLLRGINNENITRKQIIKSQSVLKSLDMLTSLDEDHCKYIVDKVLSSDEFSDLESNEILKF